MFLFLKTVTVFQSLVFILSNENSLAAPAPKHQQLLIFTGKQSNCYVKEKIQRKQRTQRVKKHNIIFIEHMEHGLRVSVYQKQELYTLMKTLKWAADSLYHLYWL